MTPIQSNQITLARIRLHNMLAGGATRPQALVAMRDEGWAEAAIQAVMEEER